MAENSKIEWCDHTFNPWIGCEPVSPGCANCYAAGLNKRFGHDNFGKGKERRRTSVANWKSPFRWNRESKTKFTAWDQMKESQGVTDQYLIDRGFTKPTRPKVFCGSMCDVFDPEVPKQWRDDLFELILKTPQLDWLLLTKRIENAQEMLDEMMLNASYGSFAWGREQAHEYPNIWLGTTVENQKMADKRIPFLLGIPAAKRFISVEPMLGMIDLTRMWIKMPVWGESLTNVLRKSSESLDDGHVLKHPSIDWVICGGESGHNARPMHPDWVRSLRDQCKEAGTPFMFKQFGEWKPAESLDELRRIGDEMRTGKAVHVYGICREHDGHFRKGDAHLRRVGKKRAGRLLDGVEHLEFPEVKS